MKRMLTLATAALLFTGAAFAHDGKKHAKGKDCCKKEGSCKKSKDSKEAKATVASVKKA